MIHIFESSRLNGGKGRGPRKRGKLSARKRENQTNIDSLLFELTVIVRTTFAHIFCDGFVCQAIIMVTEMAKQFDTLDMDLHY